MPRSPTSIADSVAPPRGRWLGTRGRWGALLVYGIFGLGLVLCVPLSHDEHMYLTAARLWANGEALYRDFAFLQTPYLPQIWGLALSAVPERANLLLFGRLTSVLAMLALLPVLFVMLRSIAGAQLALPLTTLVATHHLVLFVLPYARNHVPAMLAMVTSVMFAWTAIRSGDPERTGVINWLRAGGCAGLAIGLKLTALPAMAGLGLVTLLVRRRVSRQQRLKRATLPFAVGVVAALVPALLTSVRAGLEATWYCNVTYHQLNEQYRAAGDDPGAATLLDKVAYSLEYSVRGSGALLLIAIGVVGVAAVQGVGRRRRRANSAAKRPGRAGRAQERDAARDAVILATCVAGGCVLAALLPTPMQRDYLAPVVVFGVVALAAGLRALGSDVRQSARVPLFVIAWLSVVVAIGTNVRHLRHLPERGDWTHSRVRLVADALRARVSQPTRPGSATARGSAGVGADRVATLMPLYALLAGVDVSREFASGPFVFRVRDVEGAEVRDNAPPVVGAGQTANWLATVRPAWVLVNPAIPLHEPLGSAAQALGGRAKQLPENLQLYDLRGIALPGHGP